MNEKPANKAQLIALKNYLLENDMRDSAAACDNLLDVIACELEAWKAAEWAADQLLHLAQLTDSVYCQANLTDPRTPEFGSKEWYDNIPEIEF